MMLLKNFWKKENKEVKFGLTREYQKTYRTDHNDYIFNEAPIVSYKKFMHDFVKQDGVRYCPGLTDYYSNLYVMTMWFDLEIYFNKYKPDEMDIECNDSYKHTIQWHRESLVNTKVHFGDIFWKDIIKFHTPWAFKAPKNHAIMMRALDYHYQSNLVAISGLQFDAEPILTVPMLIRQDLGSFKISVGDPLCIIEVVDTTKKIKLVKDDDELTNHTKYFLDMQSTKIPKGPGNRELNIREPQGLTKLYNKIKGK